MVAVPPQTTLGVGLIARPLLGAAGLARSRGQTTMTPVDVWSRGIGVYLGHDMPLFAPWMQVPWYFAKFITAVKFKDCTNPYVYSISIDASSLCFNSLRNYSNKAHNTDFKSEFGDTRVSLTIYTKVAVYSQGLGCIQNNVSSSLSMVRLYIASAHSLNLSQLWNCAPQKAIRLYLPALMAPTVQCGTS